MKVFIGYDFEQDIVYKVCKYSILKQNSDIKIFPLVQKELRDKGIYYRDFDPFSSTEFSFTRFLVPHLSNYKGWSLFCDCDFLWLEDIKNLFELCDEKYAVMVVKHNYIPKTLVKMNGKVQTNYPRKNWSSMVLWNCEHPSNKKLSLLNVNQKPGSYLHQFKWLDDNEIGQLPVEWNWLVGWNSGSKPKALHYTEGGPWFDNYKDCEYNYIWNQYYDEYLNDS
jgi:lipopolysaccharide biosynthesis glycosyltransferase